MPFTCIAIFWAFGRIRKYEVGMSLVQVRFTRHSIEGEVYRLDCSPYRVTREGTGTVRTVCQNQGSRTIRQCCYDYALGVGPMLQTTEQYLDGWMNKIAFKE